MRPIEWLRYEFFAFGRDELPEKIDFEGRCFVREKVFKHDFFAATGLYSSGDKEGDKVVLKVYRQRPFLFIPMSWLGRLMAEHESKINLFLAGIEGIPQYRSRFGRTGFVRDYIPGDPLARGVKLPDSFFDDLERLIKEVHSRDIAIVDLNKMSNVILGEDGRPYLIDFQISLRKSDLPIISHISGFVIKRLQREDMYHFGKHKRRLRPDLLTDEELRASYRKSLLIRIHRFLTRPYFIICRWFMKMLDLPSAE